MIQRRSCITCHDIQPDSLGQMCIEKRTRPIDKPTLSLSRACPGSAGVPDLISDKWLSDVTLYGSASEVREGIEAWFDTGITTPIIVPSSTSGGMTKAAQELFDAFA